MRSKFGCDVYKSWSYVRRPTVWCCRSRWRLTRTQTNKLTDKRKDAEMRAFLTLARFVITSYRMWRFQAMPAFVWRPRSGRRLTSRTTTATAGGLTALSVTHQSDHTHTYVRSRSSLDVAATSVIQIMILDESSRSNERRSSAIQEDHHVDSAVYDSSCVEKNCPTTWQNGYYCISSKCGGFMNESSSARSS